jgi:hypothetical protein
MRLKPYEVRYWKQLERHPLSTSYGDLKGQSWDRFLEGWRKHGNIDDRRIILAGGKVIVGWQQQRAHVEMDIKPEYVSAPENVSEEELIELLEDNRRHEAAESIEKRVSERRERVAKAAAKGKSERKIAEQEGVSKTQIHRDLQCQGGPGDHQKNDGIGKNANSTGENRHQSRAERVGQTAIKPFPDREPGDESDAIRQAKTDRRSQGKPLFDDRKIKDAYGKLVRLLNDRAKALGQQKSQAWANVRAAMNDVITRFETWQKERS